MKIKIKQSDIKTHRQLWSEVAKKNGWYKEPFFIQIWVKKDGTIADSVSTVPMDKDYICSDESGVILTDDKFEIVNQ